MSITKRWVPVGLRKDLNIERNPSPTTGPFTGGGWKLCWHITVSPWSAVDSMVSVLKNKGAEPHFVIGGRSGFKFPVVVQLLPLDEFAKALRHPTGTPETNRANVIQVEICARPGNLRTSGDVGSTLFDFEESIPDHIFNHMRNVGDPEEFDVCMADNPELHRVFNNGVAAWTNDTYKALANLTRIIDYRVPIPAKRPRSFSHKGGNPIRYTPNGWIRVEGHVGHSLCPNNDHIDPTPDFRGLKLVNFRNTMPTGGWPL